MTDRSDETRRPRQASVRREFYVGQLGLVLSIGALAGLMIWLTVESDRQRLASAAHTRHVDLIDHLGMTFRQTAAINDYVVAGDSSKFVHYDLLHRETETLVREVRDFIRDHQEVEIPGVLLAARLADELAPGELEALAGEDQAIAEDALLARVSELAEDLYGTTRAIARLADPIYAPRAPDLIERADGAAMEIATLLESLRREAESHFEEMTLRAEREIRVARRVALGVLVVALGLSAYVLVLLLRRVVVPLVRLSREIEGIRNVADLQKRVALPASEELGQVATEFNALLQRLQEGRQAVARSREWVRTFDAISDLVFLTDDRFRIVAANRAMADYVGIDADAITGMKCGEAFEGCRNCLYPRMVEEDREVSAEINRPETARIYELTVTPLRDDSGAITGSVHVARDVTERKAIQAELLAATRLAVLGGITAGVAHEIGNPLASLSTRLRLLEERHEPEFVRGSARALQDQVDRITRTLRGIESLARPPQEERIPRQINAVVTDAVNLLRLHRAARNSEIRLVLAEDVPSVLEVKDQLMHVFLNLGLNALEAMPAGGTLTVQTTVEGDEIRVTFLDTGTGISGDARARMVYPLFSTKKRGMGLGLSIVRSIVTAHRGRIEFESEAGQGTAFTVILPAHSRDPAVVGDS